MVAVALHHARGAVVHGGLETGVAGYLLLIVALHICLVHDVEAIGVEHGVHLGLSRIVARAHRVDIGLLHHRHVAQHRLGVDGSAILRMRVLRVHALEEDSLIVDVDQIAHLLDGAEAIFC